MSIDASLLSALNAQITLELQASTVYRQLAIEADVQDLPGIALWLRRQADEEIVHANRFIDHVVDRDEHPVIGPIRAPQVVENPTITDVFTAALAHERLVSEAIRSLYRTAEQAGDLDSRPLLHDFLSEQIEEEATVGSILAQLRLVGSDGAGLLRLDAELGGRPATSTEPGKA